MQTISSRQNRIVRAFRDLADAPDPDGARLLLDGLHLVGEAIDAALEFEAVAIAASRSGEATEEGRLAHRLDARGVPVVLAGDAIFRAMSPVRSPSGIVAIVRRRPPGTDALLLGGGRFTLVAAGVQDPGNLGALVRVAEAGGASGLLVAGRSANPFSWKALRGSMGSALRLPVTLTPTLDPIVHRARTAGARLVAATPRDGRLPDAIDWRGSVVLLLGGEGRGLTAAVVSACDDRVTLPMTPPVESLNVAMAGAVLVYAARRQRGTAGDGSVAPDEGPRT